MELQKKIKCLACNDVLVVYEGVTLKCACQKVVITEGHVQGILGKDYVDVSPKLLNE